VRELVGRVGRVWHLLAVLLLSSHLLFLHYRRL